MWRSFDSDQALVGGFRVSSARGSEIHLCVAVGDGSVRLLEDGFVSEVFTADLGLWFSVCQILL